MEKVLVIGGPGNISASAIDQCIAQGKSVAVFSRPGSPFDELDARVQVYVGDRDLPGQLESAFDEFAPDVVLDLACFTPEQAERAAGLAYGKVAQFLFASTVDVYGYPLMRLPFRECDPWQERTRSVYAQKKRECEAIYGARFHATAFPLVIVRPSYSFGKRFLLSALSRSAAPSLLYRLQHDLPILAPGDGNTLIHASSGCNTGRMIAGMVGEARTIGGRYTLAHPTAMTYAEYIHLIAGALGKQPVLVPIPSEVILSVQDEAMADNLLEELTRYHVCFSIDTFMADFPDFVFEPLEQAARRAVAWNVQTGRVQPQPIIDDRIIAAYQKALQGFSL